MCGGSASRQRKRQGANLVICNIGLVFSFLFSLFSFPAICRTLQQRVMASPIRALWNSALPQDRQHTWLRELVEKEIEALSEHLGIDDAHISGCLLEDIGVLLLETLSILSEVAVSLAEGQHIKDYSNVRIEQMEKENDFSELSILEYLDAKHSSLR